MESYQLPVLLVNAETTGEAWIKTVKAVWDNGKMMPNHYEEKPSKEATVLVNVSNPLKEPRIHIADYVSTQDIKIKNTYTKEVIEGTIDHLVDKGSLSYTYHRRLFNWGKAVPKHEEQLKKMCLPTVEVPPEGINQIEYLLQKAKEENISRKLQVTTWAPWKDLKVSGAPCLQRLWFRITYDKYLIMESHWRSRDLFKAWGSNVYAMVELGKMIADKLGLKLIQYADLSNSLHIYESDFKDVEAVFKTLEKRGILL
ncbi:MAG: thymidylate synthase [Candidatus Helarchaeota archaeon]